MQYFTEDNYKTMIALEPESAAFQQLYQQFVALHQSLSQQIKRDFSLLHPDPTSPNAISQKSATDYSSNQILTLTYTRSRADARLIEELMGRDALHYEGDIETHRHPVIELRITPQHFAIELVISPDAWYDQQNFAGKISQRQHITRFYKLLKTLKGNYRLGFWKGVESNDMYLSTAQLPPDYVLREFIETFAPRRDWFRIGIWYASDDPAIATETVVKECYDRISELYQVLEFVQWNSNNNYTKFYNSKKSRSSQ